MKFFALFSENIGKINGRRARQERRKLLKEKGKDQISLTASSAVTLARTENVVSQPIERTTEVKVNFIFTVDIDCSIFN